MSPEPLDSEEKEKNPRFNFRELFFENRIAIALFLLGLILIGIGAFLYKDGLFAGSTKVEVIDATTGVEKSNNFLVIDVSGSVEKPGIYELADGSRIEDALIAAGGISGDASREWMEKMINRAAKLSDGQKIYIPSVDEQTVVLSAKDGSGGLGVPGDSSGRVGGLININTASLELLDTLSGIGPVYAQKIIEYRPYSNTEDLVTKQVLSKNLYEKIKHLLTVY